jgi:hypothetical protein
MDLMHTFIAGTGGWTWGDLAAWAVCGTAGYIVVIVDYLKQRSGWYD